jgi:hypothetical protein
MRITLHNSTRGCYHTVRKTSQLIRYNLIYRAVPNVETRLTSRPVSSVANVLDLQLPSK